MTTDAYVFFLVARPRTAATLADRDLEAFANKGDTVLKEFKDFMRRGNVIDLAVA